MKKPFTPDGLSDKLLELYALDDTGLTAQAKSLADDFKAFMSDNFTFTASQGSYLSGMSDMAATAFGFHLAAILMIRGEITMDPVPANPEPERPKEIKSDPGGYLTYDNSVPASAGIGGTLSSSISWTLL